MPRADCRSPRTDALAPPRCLALPMRTPLTRAHRLVCGIGFDPGALYSMAASIWRIRVRVRVRMR
eukprot:4062060-Prymnesium_polylepis.1